ncbi:hypothetical protein MNBD_GAMMA02-826, partial [hydrothermal vent metagenome]
MLASVTQLLISNIGWALIHFLWQGTLITLAYWVITRSIESIHAKYWTGMGLVLLSLIVPIININSTSLVNSSEELMIPLSNTIISHQQLGFEGLFFYFINASLPYIVLIWAFTVALLSIRLIRSWLQLAAIKHQCDSHISNELKQYIRKIAIKLDLPTIPFLKISTQVMVPAAYGMLKPTILLPLSLLSQIPRNQLEAIIKHELCHLKRHDFIHNIIQLFADTILFFHPGIRWMNNDIRHVREQCCDQMVLSHDTEKLTYAKALTNIAAYTNGMNLKHSVHIGINDGVLLNRVKFLLQNKSSQSSLMIFLPFLLFIVIAIILLQPGQNLTEKSASILAHVNQQYRVEENQSFSPQQKFMSNQFYPKLDKQAQEQKLSATINETIESNRIPTTVTDSNLNIATQSKPISTDINKNQLQIELAQNMQLQNIEANVLPDGLTPYEPITHQPIAYNSEQQQVIESYQSSSNIDLDVKPRGINSSTNTTLVSFSNTDSISITPKFKRYMAPEYPKTFWYNQIEQDVIATFKIQSNGRAYDISLSSQNNNYVAFEQAVEKAMKRWKFDVNSLNNSTLQRTYQQMFSF